MKKAIFLTIFLSLFINLTAQEQERVCAHCHAEITAEIDTRTIGSLSYQTGPAVERGLYSGCCHVRWRRKNLLS